MKKTELKALKQDASPLTRKVINVILDQGDTDEMKAFITDVLQHGCQSGIVGELVYYHDTTDFYNKYKRDIQNILQELLSDYGYNSPDGLFGEKWDSDDPLVEDTLNQNLLAWFGFEETCRKIADELEIEY